MEYATMDRPATYIIDHNYLVQAHADGDEVERHLTDDYREAQQAFARMCDEGKGSVVTIYDSRKLDYVARFAAGTKRHKLTRELIELMFNPAS
jgi:hypothetical protein